MDESARGACSRWRHRASAWDFDPATDAEWFERLDREKASALLGAGYAVRKLLGRHPVGDVAEPVNDDVFDASEFEARAERARKPRRSALMGPLIRQMTASLTLTSREYCQQPHLELREQL